MFTLYLLTNKMNGKEYVGQKPIRWTEEQKQRFSALRKAHPTSSVFQKGHVFFPSKTEGVV